MSITPLSSSALAQSSLFTSLADTNSATPTSLVTLLDPTADTTGIANPSVFPEFPTASILSASLDANLGTSTVATTAASSSDPNAITSLNQDFTTLLKDLASGNVSTSQSAVAKLQADLNSGGSTAASSTSSTTSSTNPLQKLLTSISSSLSSGDTTGALTSLASYFIQSGSSTNGSLLNTSA